MQRGLSTTKPLDIHCNSLGDHSERSFCNTPDVWCCDDVRQREYWVICGKRLLPKDIQFCAGKMPAGELRVKRLSVDHTSPSDVDDICSVWEGREFTRTNHTPHALGISHAQNQNICCSECLVPLLKREAARETKVCNLQRSRIA